MSTFELQRWFVRSLENDQIVVRLHMTPNPLGMRTMALAWCGWSDDVVPNGVMFGYSHGENDRDGLSPLSRLALSSRVGLWGDQFVQALQPTPALWAEQKAVVCTLGPDFVNVRKVPPSHPLALTHLSAFWGMAAATSSGDPYWAQSFRVVVRRLGGLVMASAHAASHTVEVS